MKVKVVYPFQQREKVICLSEGANVYDLLQELDPLPKNVRISRNLEGDLPLHAFEPATPLAIIGIKHLDTLHLIPPNEPRPLTNERKRNFMVEPMPDDNSCLFWAMSFLFQSSDPFPQFQRELIRKLIFRNQHRFNDQILGQDRFQYMEWIRKPTTWGGAIELAIFSQHYQCQIVCVQVQTKQMLIFGEKENYQERVFVIYSGIHYDAVKAVLNKKGEYETKFDVDDEEAWEAVQEICNELHTCHAYTDMANFSLTCDSCGSRLKGEKEAEIHAYQTKHDSFSEINDIKKID